MDDEKSKYPEFPDLKVLVMDDEQSILKILGKTLQMLKCPHLLAENGSQAIKDCEEESKKKVPFDIAILDLMVSNGMGGVATARRMKKVCPNTTLVLTSGQVNSPIMVNYKEHGFDFKLPKPFSVKQFDDLLKEIHDQKKKY
jgi:two-component system, cell cycle sensor histidine kinase and response regulator CckA